jgi:predicted trehalose synthase
VTRLRDEKDQILAADDFLHAEAGGLILKSIHGDAALYQVLRR